MGIYKRTQNTHTYEMALSMQSALAGKQITVNKVSSKRSVNKTVVQASNLSEKLSKAAVTAATTAALFASSAQAITFDDLQVKGSGLANTCPVVEGGSGPKALKGGDYKFDKFCVEPTSFTVKEEKADGSTEFVKTKLMTRLTYTLDAMSGDMKVGSDGSVNLTETDGIDYAPTTVQLAGGERVPFLFTLKELQAKGNTSQFGGDFVVASYRGSSFL